LYNKYVTETSPYQHQSGPTLLEKQQEVAWLELQAITSGLWHAVGFNKDPIEAAMAAFPKPAQRRSDTEFTCSPEEEESLRERAAALGPGRKEAETLSDLGVEKVDAEIIEPGQLHKTVTELWLALGSRQTAPIIVFASDREVPLWAKDHENEQVDSERLSTARLMAIGGQGLAGVNFFYRAGEFDAKAEENRQAIQAQALAPPHTEYEITEKFLRTALDETTDDIVLPFGYDPEDGRLIAAETGQVRQLGVINDRDIILVHKEKSKDGSALKTTATTLLMGRIAAAIVNKDEATISYYTSATYKPSRWMSGIRAGILAAQSGNRLKFVVPTYGYADLSSVKGDKNPTPPIIENIASEMGRAAQEASDLREFLTSL
jgi:hypothetical protein